jgi:hypothetical protein
MTDLFMPRLHWLERFYQHAPQSEECLWQYILHILTFPWRRCREKRDTTADTWNGLPLPSLALTEAKVKKVRQSD